MKIQIVAALVILSSLIACQAFDSYRAINLSSVGSISYTQSWGVSSQMRGVFIAQQSLGNSPNFATIASTLSAYGINLVTIEIIKNYETCYQSAIVPLTVYPAVNFTQCIDAFHARGIQVYAHFDTMYKEYSGDGIDRDAWYIPSGGNLGSLQKYGWLDIANSATTSLIRSLITELVNNYKIDGICFDYTRWDDSLMPLSNSSKMQFSTDTGLDVDVSYATWLSDVVPVAEGGNGRYFSEFQEWRTSLVSTFVKNMTQWALAINPNLKFGASPHGYGLYGLSPSYWCLAQGQDVNYWISQGYLDWVAPMIYSNTTSDFSLCVQAFIGNATGSAHGRIPICPFITNQVTNNRTTADVVRYVNTMLASGGDGWILWEYGGPGDPNADGSPDIRPYLAALGLPNPATFRLGNPTFQALNGTAEQVTWTTTSAANSSLEYSSSPLYTWIKVHDARTNFDYWKITRVNGTLITDSTLTTTHTVIITGLTVPYHIHIMSGDISGVATFYKLHTGV